jgi:hypothetical protein
MEVSTDQNEHDAQQPEVPYTNQQQLPVTKTRTRTIKRPEMLIKVAYSSGIQDRLILC